ncbi:MAG: Holliday junction resolvase RuvX [Acidimicrobiaceae bacterium]|nr:Holliday junction resolvase RuvX [Acidimicrobiaceae bacterium]MCY4176049.1 Holliday junction resolvase RuvX [Acidimicrobiaceae bacterium]MCY4279707.1 Holliday junction resolvase RuvX [Acidimicrobiaceae bacterium]MCY4294962.1 Holliday junction resolvase RuvX [Acidimicrobiaceae bacterium]
MGIDLGERRVGVAVCDSAATVATPVATLARSGDPAQDLQAIADQADEWQAEIVVVGLPVSLDGSEGPAAEAARAEIARLGQHLKVPVVSYDERFTTVIAERSLMAQQMKGPRRRGVVDRVAAAVMLQSWIDAGMPRG